MSRSQGTIYELSEATIIHNRRRRRRRWRARTKHHNVRLARATGTDLPGNADRMA